MPHKILTVSKRIISNCEKAEKNPITVYSRKMFSKLKGEGSLFAIYCLLKNLTYIDIYKSTRCLQSDLLLIVQKSLI